jgi:hypothetical protein
LLFTDFLSFFGFDFDFEPFDYFDFEAFDYFDFDRETGLPLFPFDLDFDLPLLEDFFAFPSSKICPSAMVCCMVLVPDNFFKSLALDSSLDFSILFIFDAFDYLDLLLDLE